MRIVVDTNVIVSAVLKPESAPARLLLRVLADEAVTLLVDERIIDEYREVLSRKKFSFDAAVVGELIDAIAAVAVFIDDAPAIVNTPTPLDDRPFLEVATSGAATVLITGNKRHFPATGPVAVLGPAEFLLLLEDEP